MNIPYTSFYVRTAMYIGGALAAFVLAGAMSLGLIAAWELQGYIETRHSTLAEEAAQVLAAGGEERLISWMSNEASIPENVSVYILNDDSEDILGRKIPEYYVDFIRESVIGSPGQEHDNYQPVRLAPMIIAPDGKIYAVLIIPKGISLWGSNATIIGLLIVAALVIASVAWLIARTITRPISELQLAVRELASGDIDTRVPAVIAERKDELGNLAADFNIMADRLQQLIAGRENLFQEMSHELRSPLARLQASIALAAERPNMDIRDQIEREIARMNHVIGEMLRYSSLGAKVSNKRQLMRVNRRLAGIVENEEVEAVNNGCRIELDSESGLAVIGDPELLVSGFENIIRNAIRFAPPETAVEIVARRQSSISDEADKIIVTISDRGPGVATEGLEKIFEPYFRMANGSDSKHKDSTGLGLAIVKRVFSHHGGTVSAKQRSGGGLTITVVLPAAVLD